MKIIYTCFYGISSKSSNSNSPGAFFGIATLTYVIPGAPTTFKNCDAMREYYPSGVASSHPAYAPARDGDKDGWACEPPK